MNLQFVASTNVSAIGYDSDSMTLEVHFTNGSVYQYFDVPQSVYEEFMGSPSKGQYINLNIRNAYRYMRL